MQGQVKPGGNAVGWPVDLKFDKDPANSTFSIYDQEKVFGKMKSKYPQLVDYEDYLPTVAAFLGCDYIPRI
jgi:hypothetical protein